MQPTRGSIVISKAGKDKGMKLAVLAVEGDYCLLTNGKLRPLQRPKRKKLKHLQPTAIVLPEESLQTNKQIRKALAGQTVDAISPA